MNPATISQILGQQYYPGPYQQMVQRRPPPMYPPYPMPPLPYIYRSCSGCGNYYRGGGSCEDRDRRDVDRKFKTKEVAIRGKVYKVRNSFLDDNGKFEAELIKFVDKKKEKALPNQVIQYLVDLINDEGVSSRDLLDLVTLNILASNMAVKSVMASSLKLVEEEGKKTWATEKQMTEIIGCIFLSSKVDDGLKEWLKEYAREHKATDQLRFCTEWRKLIDDHPDVATQLAELLGLRPAPDDSGIRIQ